MKPDTITVYKTRAMGPTRPPQHCTVCGVPGCIEGRGANFHAGNSFGSLVCDYNATPPFADAEWARDPDAMCLWCAGTGHPYGDESYGMCECPLRHNARA